MAEWILVDPDVINAPSIRRIHGADVEVSAAPQDVPEAVLGFYDKENRCYVVQFKYLIGDEALVVGAADNGIRLLVGRDSRPLHRIEIRSDSPQREHLLQFLSPRISEGLKELQIRLGPKRDENYRATEQVISTTGTDLFRLSG